MNNYIANQNPWWISTTGSTTNASKKRFAFDQIKSIIKNTGLMVFLSGIRRVGKSTLVNQLIQELIVEGVNPSAILFVELSQTYNNLEEVLSRAVKYSYVFIDEIQFAQNWRDLLKVFYDQNKNHTKILFTGSATANYTVEKESLLGRFIPVVLKPLSFAEFLHLKYIDYTKKELWNEENFLEFCFYGEFPQLIFIEDEIIKSKYISDSIINPFLSQDVALYGIDLIQKFRDLIIALSTNVGQIINKKNISEEIGLNRITLNKYYEILKDSGYISEVSNYYKSRRKSILSSKKIYFDSVNILLSIIGIKKDQIKLIQGSIWGHIFENIIYNEISKNLSEDYFYYRRGQMEVDFVKISAVESRAYEIKTANKVNPNKLKSIELALSKEQIGEFQLIYSGVSTGNTLNYLDFLYSISIM